MSMFPAFTATNRRKRIATYGKSSRTAVASNWNDDATSPERPRKQAGVLNGATRRPTAVSGDTSTGTSNGRSAVKAPISRHASDTHSDEDESEKPRTPAPRKKAAVKQKAVADVFDVPSSSDEVVLPQGRRKTPQTSRKLGLVRPTGPAVQPGPELERVAPIDVFDVPSSDGEDALPQARQGKTPQTSRKPDLAIQSLRNPRKADLASPDAAVVPSRQRVKTSKLVQKAPMADRKVAETQPAVQQRNLPRTTTHSASLTAAQKRIQRPSSLISKEASRKPAPDLGVFDVPSSDDEAHIPSPRRHKLAPILGGKTTKGMVAPGSSLSPIAVESDESSSSKKRKRQDSSQASVKGRGVGADEHGEEGPIAPRGIKYQKNGNRTTAIARGDEISLADSSAENKKADPPVNKPKRTRLRTAPGAPKPPLGKNQSSPAELHGMLAVRGLRKHSPVIEMPELAALEDETMYDIPEIPGPATPISKKAKLSKRSVTPRQKQLFSNLLEGPSDAMSPGMPSIRALKLTDRKPGLSRSSSDIPQTTHTRKARLVDRLKKLADGSEEEDSESDEETDQEMGHITPKHTSKSNTASRDRPTSGADDDVDQMDVDSGAPSQSQNSQNALLTSTGSRVTYAQQRSYRQESTMEDGLLLAMDFQDPFPVSGFASKPQQDPDSDDEDDPASQVRGIHELRRQGENQKFHLETQIAIDDIADKAGLGKSVRRSAILDFCSRMADRKFLDLLLDSASLNQFLASIDYTGEIIFDFVACVAVAFILEARPDSTVLDQVYASGIIVTLAKLLEFDADISRIARERKTNLSKVGRESVENFRALVLTSSIWSAARPDKVTPQMVALRTLELLVLGLRKAGNRDALVDEDVVVKLLDVMDSPCQRLKAGKEPTQDMMVLSCAFSIMEALSISNDMQTTWSSNVLQRLADTTSVFFTVRRGSPITLAARLCILLTNNKPKACEVFAGRGFVAPLIRYINDMFSRLADGVSEEGSEVQEHLILGLGAMINIAEFSDGARASVVADGDEMLDALAKTFVEGSERAALADSVEESKANIPIGYLTVLLGNLCLNGSVRSKMQWRLPGHGLSLLVDKVKEFVSFHERVDRMTEQFEGDEGKEVSKNYTKRLLLVVKKLEMAETER